MANPVFDRLESQWNKTTPAGYPTMPGYQPGGSAASTQTYPGTNAGAPSPSVDPRYPYAAPTAYPTYDQQALGEAEQAYAEASADAVDRGRMTYDDVIVRTGALLGVLIVAAAGAWFAASVNLGLGMALMGVGLIVGLVLALVTSFSQTPRPALIVAYAAAEGLAMGGLSFVMESVYPGIVVQAVIATAAIFGVTLALFASGKVRNSPKLMRFTLVALVGILVYRLINIVLVWAGVLSKGGLNDAKIMGIIPLGVAVGILAVLVGAACLIQDFDEVKVGVAAGVPATFAWMCAFGLMVTIVWMYVEILQLLARLRD